MRSFSKRPCGRSLACALLFSMISATAPTSAMDGAKPAPGTPGRSAQPVAPEAVPVPEATADANAATSKSAAGEAAPATAPGSAPVPTEPGRPDIFNEQAQKTLESERITSSTRVHPLANKFPDQDVIVCSAGCEPGGRVVYKQAKATQRAVDTAEMVPSSAQAGSGSVIAKDNALTCVAGCYSTPKVYRAVEKRADLVPLTTVAPVAAESGADAGKVQKARQPTMGSGDWMNKINEDRKAKGAPAP
jgi:hypothetical protein